MLEMAKRMEASQAVALVDLVGRVQGQLAAVVAEATVASAVTAAEGVALRAIAAAPEGLSQSSWARSLGVSRQRAHVLAAALAARGLLAVEPAGRSSRVRLTPAGNAAIAAQTSQLGEAVSTRLAAYPDGDALMGLLGRLVVALGA